MNDPASAKLRINFVLRASGLDGGVRVIAIYAQRLQAMGHDVTVVSGVVKRPWRQRLSNLLRGGDWGRAKIPPRTHFEGREVKLRRLERDRPIVDADLPDADVTIATWWMTAAWVEDLSARKGAKAYLVQHDERWVGGSDAQVGASWAMPCYKILVADWLVPLIREAGIDHELAVVPNAVDPDQFSAAPRGKQARPTVGLMYSTVPFKGCDVSLKAFELARKQIPELRLVAFGIASPSIELPLPAGTIYHEIPAQERIATIYASCDAWLFASRSEGFGLPILEAMACRTPVIAAPAGAAPQLVPPGGGTLVPLEDPAAMAQAIVGFAQMDESTWRQRSAAAHRTASRLNWDDAARGFEAALRRAVQLNGAPGQSGAIRRAVDPCDPGHQSPDAQSQAATDTASSRRQVL